jgi:Tfp pilus assembly protein PilN
MSILTDTATTTGLVTLPRVNLLPPEVGDRRRLKKVQTGLGIGVLAAAGIVGALVVAAGAQVSNAQSELDAQQARSTTLQAESAKYADVPAVYAEVESAKAQLSQAMGKEIRWSYVLNDLSVITPGKVWLTGVTATQQVDSAAVTAAPALAGTAAYGTPGIGTITFQGSGSTHNDVASWLKALATETGFADPYFTRSAQVKIGTHDSVSFDSTAVITEDRLSGRFTDKAGS